MPSRAGFPTTAEQPEHPLTVMLVWSSHFGWRGLRALLEHAEYVHIVADLAVGLHAAEVAARMHPRVILAAADVPTPMLAQLVTRISAASPESTIILLDDIVDQETLRELGRGGIAGYLVWNELTDDMVRPAIEGVAAGLSIGSHGPAQEAVAKRSQYQRERDELLHLTPWQRIVLDAVAAGLLLREIADRNEVSVRKVQRTIVDLCDMLEVEGLPSLRQKAHESGYGR